MNKTLTLGIATAAILVLALPANAYHILNGGGPNPTIAGSTDPEQWTAQVGAPAPANDPTCPGLPVVGPLPPPLDILNCLFGFQQGDVLVGFIACEDNGDGTTTPSQSGAGGLCDMSPGFDTSGTSCAFTTTSAGGRSNGNAPAYNGGACIAVPLAGATSTTLPVINSPEHNWYQIQMTDGGVPVTFHSQINGVDCSASDSLAVDYDDQYAYTVADGLVSGFPGHSPQGVGTYTVTFLGSETSTTPPAITGAPPVSGDNACSGPAPWYQE